MSVPQYKLAWIQKGFNKQPKMQKFWNWWSQLSNEIYEAEFIIQINNKQDVLDCKWWYILISFSHADFLKIMSMVYYNAICDMFVYISFSTSSCNIVLME